MFERLQNAWHMLMYEDATPNKIALGFAVGLFTSFFPTPVVDTVAALALAYLVRGNRAACLFGNSLGLMMFPIIPVVLGVEYLIGRTLLHVPAAHLSFQNGTFLMFLKSQRGTYFSLVVGALVLAVPAAVMGFVIVRSGVSYYQAIRRNRT